MYSYQSLIDTAVLALSNLQVQTIPLINKLSTANIPKKHKKLQFPYWIQREKDFQFDTLGIGIWSLVGMEWSPSKDPKKPQFPWEWQHEFSFETLSSCNLRRVKPIPPINFSQDMGHTHTHKKISFPGCSSAFRSPKPWIAYLHMG